MSTSENLVRICGVGDLPAEGEVREIQASRVLSLCVAKINGKVTALDNECPHHGGPLGEGMVENGKVMCPWHAYAFDLVTGVCEDYPEMKARVFEITVVGDDVLAKL